MSHACRVLALVVVVGTFGPAAAEIRRDLEVEPAPLVLNPDKLPEARVRHYEALKLYLNGRRYQTDSRFLDAVQAYEAALKLEPNSAAICKALAALCFALERDEQALEYCRKALALDANDYELLYRYGREMQERGQLEEAIKHMAKAATLPEAKAHPDQLALMCFSLGVAYEDSKQYEKAASAFEQVAAILEQTEVLQEVGAFSRRQIEGEAAKTYERLGRVHLRAENYDQAVAAFRKAQDKDPLQAGRLHYNLSEVYLAQKRPHQALEHLQKYIQTQPAGSEAYELLVMVLTQLKRTADIIPALEDSAERDRYNLSLKLVLAKQYAEAGRAKQAEELFTALWRDNPTEETYEGLAKLHQKQGRGNELLTMLDQDLGNPRRLLSAQPQVRVLAGNPELVKAVAAAALALPNDKPLAFNTCRILAALCRQAKLYEPAERFCRQCLVEDPNPGEIYLELCRTLSESKQYEAEAEACRQALAKELKVPAIVFQLEMARALALASKDKEAVAAAQQAVQQSKQGSAELAEASFTLAVVYYRCNQLDEALKTCEQLLAQVTEKKERRQVHYLMSGIYSARHDNAKAEGHLQKLLEIDPEDAGANNDLGYLWADQSKNLEEAERMIRKAIELDRAARAKRQGALEIPEAEQDNAAYIDSLGWVLYRRGRLQEACEQLQRATRLADGDDPTIWEHLGDVYRDLGKLDQAKVAWEKALELYKTSKRHDADDRRQALEDKLKLLAKQPVRKPVQGLSPSDH